MGKRVKWGRKKEKYRAAILSSYAKEPGPGRWLQTDLRNRMTARKKFEGAC